MPVVRDRQCMRLVAGNEKYAMLTSYSVVLKQIVQGAGAETGA